MKTLAFGLLMILTMGCGGSSSQPVAAPDLQATIDGSVATAIASLPTATAMPTPNINAAVEGRVAAAIASLPTPSAIPTPDLDAMVVGHVATAMASYQTPPAVPTHDINATVESQMSATVAAMPTATSTSTPDISGTVESSIAATVAAMPTATAVPKPSPTIAVTPTPTVEEMINRVRPSVVRISHSGGSGSGVIFHTDDEAAYILTNLHVIGDATIAIPVEVNNSQYFDAIRVGYNRFVDLAVLQIPCNICQAVPIGRLADVNVGASVVSIGYPKGAVTGNAIITRGVVSAIGPLPGYQGGDTIQTDAALNPGNSGGPMFSLSGEVIGINTFKRVGVVIEGQGFAIPADTLREEVVRLRHGAVLDELAITLAPFSRDFLLDRGSTLAFSVSTNSRVDFRIQGPGDQVIFSEDSTLFVEGEFIAEVTGIYRFVWNISQPNIYIRLRFEYEPVVAEPSSTTA